MSDVPHFISETGRKQFEAIRTAMVELLSDNVNCSWMCEDIEEDRDGLVSCCIEIKFYGDGSEGSDIFRIYTCDITGFVDEVGLDIDTVDFSVEICGMELSYGAVLSCSRPDADPDEPADVPVTEKVA